MRYLVFVLVVVAGLAIAQEPVKPQHAKVIRLQNTLAQSVANLIDPIVGKTVRIGMDRQLNIITLSGPPEAVAIIEN